MSLHSRHEEMNSSNELIDAARLINLPLFGRKFTWYKPNGKAMNRLDRFLLLENWLVSWPQSSQWGLMRGLFDHCAVLLQVKSENWGPKHFRILNCWRVVVGDRDFVKEQWGLLQV